MNNISIPNMVYDELLINDYKYNKILELVKRHSALVENDELVLDVDFISELLNFISLNEELFYNSLVEKYKECQKR